MESKIRIKLGPIEVDYEGSESFLKQELPVLIKTVTEMSRSLNIKLDDAGSGKSGGAATGKELQLSTKSIAAKLTCLSGPDLVLAAAANLEMVQGNGEFSRKQLLKEMQSATGYYKSSYSKNLSKYLKTVLGDGSITEATGGNFSLSAKKLDEIRRRIA
ncbi:MAG: hypothetical protein HZC54_02605 [Verrucomicrobia bacterium]|nr:hypothetical protein [Verrucomicrobiota bacterium]